MMRKLLFVGFVVLVAAAAAAWWEWTRLTTPYKGFAVDEVFVDLPPGSSVSTIARRLAEAGVVVDTVTFRVAARLSGDERRLQAGEYRFAGTARPGEIVGRLVAGDVFVRPLTFPEGLTIREMAGVFEKSGRGTSADFLAAAANVSLVAALDPEARSLEGYLFPDTYTLARQDDATDVVAAMAAGFLAVFDDTLRGEAAASGMSIRQVVTLASLIEKETAVASERPIVSAVYQNRLRLRMPLQCDPTVIYAMMLRGRWNGNIRRADLALDSPYNTYRYPGLPPGPIASPGRASIEAALRPADVPYLYFVSRNDGTHVFSRTLAEHNRAVNQYQRGR
jgi:UPF0755 protein